MFQLCYENEVFLKRKQHHLLDNLQYILTCILYSTPTDVSSHSKTSSMTFQWDCQLYKNYYDNHYHNFKKNVLST